MNQLINIGCYLSEACQEDKYVVTLEKQNTFALSNRVHIWRCIIIIIIIIERDRQRKAGRVIYTLSNQRPQPHNMIQ